MTGSIGSDPQLVDRVMTVGITGHTGLTAHTRELVSEALNKRLGCVDGHLVGMTALADGADQVFAEAVLAQDGEVVFVQACERIEESLDSEARSSYTMLRRHSVRSVLMPYTEPSETAFYDAGRYIADQCDLLLAVWDGEPARGLGGTGDVVSYRREIGLPWERIWPAGSRRSNHQGR